MKITRLVLRAVIGGLFVGHGTQKLFGWFGGPGPQGTQKMMSSLDMHPPRQHAVAAGLTETVSGALLALGLATPAAAAGLTGVMLTAIRKVHASKGLWNAKGGFEYNLVLICALLALADGEADDISLDRLLGIRTAGFRWALAALGAGAAGSALAVESGRRSALAAARRSESSPGEPAGEGEPALAEVAGS